MTSLGVQTTAGDQMTERTVIVSGTIIDPPTTSTAEADAAAVAVGVTLHRTTVPWLAGCVIAVLVLAGVCAVAAAVYAYIYYTRIKTRRPSETSRGSTRKRKYEKQVAHEPAVTPDRSLSTHIFMFKS